MKQKFKDTLVALCKDYGLSDKALDELVSAGQQLIADDATEDVVKAQANFFANIAKSMQSEVTRKVQAARTQPTPSSVNNGNPDDKNGGGKPQPNPIEDNEQLKLIKAMQEQINTLIKANEKAEAERAETHRQVIVKEAAKKAGLSENMLRYYDTSKIKTAEDAEKLFSEIRQEMVNSNLRPKGAGGVRGEPSDADRSEAEAWAKTLPDR